MSKKKLNSEFLQEMFDHAESFRFDQYLISGSKNRDYSIFDCQKNIYLVNPKHSDNRSLWKKLDAIAYVLRLQKLKIVS